MPMESIRSVILNPLFLMSSIISSTLVFLSSRVMVIREFIRSVEKSVIPSLFFRIDLILYLPDQVQQPETFRVNVCIAACDVWTKTRAKKKQMTAALKRAVFVLITIPSGYYALTKVIIVSCQVESRGLIPIHSPLLRVCSPSFSGLFCLPPGRYCSFRWISPSGEECMSARQSIRLVLKAKLPFPSLLKTPHYKLLYLINIIIISQYASPPFFVVPWR